MKLFCHALLLLMTLVYTSLSFAANWQSLSPAEQQALAPLAEQWHSIPAQQQKQLRDTASSFSLLNPEQKQRFHQRLTVWIKLTPEQRDAARDKYRAFSSVPEEIQAEVKQMLKQGK